MVAQLPIISMFKLRELANQPFRSLFFGLRAQHQVADSGLSFDCLRERQHQLGLEAVPSKRLLQTRLSYVDVMVAQLLFLSTIKQLKLANRPFRRFRLRL